MMPETNILLLDLQVRMPISGSKGTQLKPAQLEAPSQASGGGTYAEQASPRRSLRSIPISQFSHLTGSDLHTLRSLPLDCLRALQKAIDEVLVLCEHLSIDAVLLQSGE